MATLYKRYIPPKKPVVAESPASTLAVPKAQPAPVTEQKRKRERTEEEVAERKAKKLKKKGIDPATVTVPKKVEPELSAEQVEDVVPEPSNEAEPEVDVQDDAGPQPQGEFAHIKNAKKRHKLEKEARAARKAAQKAGVDIGTEATTVEASQGVHESTATTEPEQGESTVKQDRKKPRKRGPEEQTRDVADATQDEEVGTQGQYMDVDVSSKGINVVGDDQEAIDGTEPVPVSQAHDVAKPKKRGHKLENVLAGVQKEDAEEEEDEHLTKHASVISKFQKSAKRSMSLHEEESFEKLPAPPVVRDLELPAPERTPTPEFQNENEALPEWLAKPTIVPSDTKATFRDIGLRSEVCDRLTKLTFDEALPVQQTLLPILLQPGTPGSTFPPATEDIVPDVAVSAPTGSGKTIAYLLPIIEALRELHTPGELGALIIVPTRELVMQVAAVAESLAKGSDIRIGMSGSTGTFRDEQGKIISHGRRYDPAGYKTLVAKATAQLYPADDEAEVDTDGYIGAKEQQRIDDAVAGLVQHVPAYTSAVDILVATPGRLLEHINNTIGFSLVHLKWLVIDEADKLLDNQYEGFLESLNAELERPRTVEEQDARERYLRQKGRWEEWRERKIRKVILSATMTKDISKLTTLKLRRPQMVIVRGTEGEQQVIAGAEATEEDGVKQTADGFELPRTLVEYSIPVGDGAEKPLVAFELLRTRILRESDSKQSNESDSDAEPDSDDSSEVSSDSESDSESDSDVRDSSSSEDEIDTALMDPSRKRELANAATQSKMKAHQAARTSETDVPTVLIFTSRNESATRLSHLLKGIQPSWSRYITTLVKTTKPRIASKKSEPAIIVSTDRAARGLDSIAGRPITHVVQYDVPRSVESYVHHVGRTARAGRTGQAWTLVTRAEGKWFNETISGVKVNGIRRRMLVEQVKMRMQDDDIRQRYEEVLEGMKEEVYGGK
ncbi:ATP-dependent RNA helicase dbp6 [Fulvia fulva]|uniref:ATP-dependent RNA helicase n=1 Tax=Passalora fulva TaxID=5499 RepID=A0A9Q8LAW7_PASFU|nr:ATP-dependent RNA helicase dbp6 [Fulvia fulva]KAK4630925.1 ATP-dependent RNA helicase dbp6 [Fulvia fulva]KAK4633416.1 ATP-dependent RNA helicase dbp6 [Fulvia fulva]UJO14005.1 ATP-dependent RNA helicase dbp6 [Fulvia fulva]WPV11200.1 ATP-dependent RNA helicase dbp6 [Fulvia fulva]WPV25499.1 ATP-dependent RNA helicase dbp6 [Fulvia fulva]